MESREEENIIQKENAYRRLISYYMFGCVGTSIAMLGIVANILSLIVLCQRSMRNSNTNLYLIALAVADFLVLITSLLTFIKDTRHDEFAAAEHQIWSDMPSLPSIYIYSHAFALLFQVCSVWLTVAFTTDRYVMICHPFFAQRNCTKKSVCIIIILIYITSGIYSIPRFFEQEVFKFNYLITNNLIKNLDGFDGGGNKTYLESLFENSTDKESWNMDQLMSMILNGSGEVTWCATTPFGHSTLFRIGYHLICWLIFVVLLPLVSISIMNVFLIVEVRKSRNRSNSTLSTDNQQEGRNDTNVMLIGVIFLFLICQIPAAVSHVMWGISGNKLPSNASYIFMEISNLLIILNSALNILPYYFFGKTFRLEFVKLFCPKRVQRKLLINMRRNPYPLPRDNNRKRKYVEIALL